MGVAGLPTAFVARHRKNAGAPNLGVIVEYDALRGTKGAFHGDQHSTQGPIGIAAAVAMAEYLSAHRLPGSVTGYGTPGEEMMPPVAKTVMFDAGVFNDSPVRQHRRLAQQHPSGVTRAGRDHRRRRGAERRPRSRRRRLLHPYPDAIYLAQLTAMIDDAARAAALGTGTKVKIDHYGALRNGIAVSSLSRRALTFVRP
jgi:metal-dependent amidase/aminoacylase/carboxypeptidase family protein